MPPDPAEVERAARLIDEAKRPLVMTGRGAMRRRRRARRASSIARAPLYLDTQESRGLVSGGARRRSSAQCAAVPCRRRTCVIVVGRKLDYQTGYGSPAIFAATRASCASPTTGRNCARTAAARSSFSPTPALALVALAQAAKRRSPRLDTQWTTALRSEHVRRAVALRRIARERARRQGRTHASEPDLRGAARRCSNPMRSPSPTAATS